MNPTIISISASYSAADNVDTVYGLGQDGQVYWWDADKAGWQLLKN